MHPGKYFIKETKTNNNYILDDKMYEVNLGVNENNRVIDVFLELDNYLKKGNLIIKKTDFDNNTPIKDTKFIIMKDKEVIYEGLTNEEGILKLDNLPLGTYEVKEVVASTGYVLSELIYEVKIEQENEDTIIEIKNELEKGKLIIKKIDANDNEALKDTEFIITKDNEVIYQGTTNEEGILELDNLPFGKYIIKETKASTGYIINEEELEVTIDTNIKYIEIKNIPNTNLTKEEVLYIERKRKN